MKFIFSLTLFAISICCVQNSDAMEAQDVELSRQRVASLPIMISERASADVRKSADDLADYLSKLSAANFVVETGDGSRGIVVGRVVDFTNLPFTVEFESGLFHREDYVLRSHSRGLYLLGTTDLAVSHAIWDLLYRLGYRQFFPGPKWEVFPTPQDLSVAVDASESPDFYSRRIWYNWGLWGYNDEPYAQWCIRNRATQGFRLNSGHSYDGILAANQDAFAAHPEYFAEVDGERRIEGGDIKFCISNPGLRRLVVDHVVRTIKASPGLDSVSMDPSDGGNWCTCEACQAMGSPSDRALTLANEVAHAINELGLGDKYVGMYAYNEHSPPPKVIADPHVIISVTTAFLRGGFSFDQIIEGWQAQGATTGVYDYLSVVAWDWNLPGGGKAAQLAAVRESIPRYHQQGARFYDAESGDCWGPCGLGYFLAARLMWNTQDAAQTENIVDDFLIRAFGTASEPMREFYRLINQDTNRRPPADQIGRMYRALDEARKATSDSAVQARLDDLVLYSRYAELYYGFAAGTQTVEEVARHAYRIRKTMMVHSYGIWSRLVSQQAALADDHPWKNEDPFSADEIAKILRDGINHNEPVDPGFQSTAFSPNLVPTTPLALAKVELGHWPESPQDHQRFHIWVNQEDREISMKVRVDKRWANRMPKLSLYSPQEVTIEAVATDESYLPDGIEREIKLTTPYQGLHRVETIDGGDNTYIEWPAGMPVTLESGIHTPHVTEHFRGAWSLYFYVPKGTLVVGGWASRIANWAPRISGRLLDGSGREVFDFATADEGWFRVPVPAGEDGKLWKFDQSQGQRLLMTVPPYLARCGEELLLPAEVVLKDAARD